MDLTARVTEAAGHFDRGDYDDFAACFHPRVTVYGEAELARAPLARSREEWRALALRWRDVDPEASVALEHLAQRDGGVVADAIVMGASDSGGWRLALAIRFADGLISEIRPFWQRDSAWAALIAGP